MITPIIQIFKAGIHTASNGQTAKWTEKDIQDIVDQYNNQPLGSKHEAPIIGGDHNKVGKKALGFVQKLIKKGSEMFAEIIPTPELIDDVRNNRYRHVSIGLNSDGNFDHLAVLGAVNPAVKGLDPLQFSESEIKSILEFSLDNTQFNNLFIGSLMNPLQVFRDALQQFILDKYGKEPVVAIMAEFDKLLQQSGLDQSQPPQQGQGQPQGFGNQQNINPFHQRIASQFGPQFSESEEGKKLISEMEKQHLEMQKQKRKINELEFSAYVDKQITKILPTNKDLAVEILQNLSEQETNFSEGQNKLNGIDLFKKFVSNLPVAVDTNEIAKRDLEFTQTSNNRYDEIKKLMQGDK